MVYCATQSVCSEPDLLFHEKQMFQPNVSRFTLSCFILHFNDFTHVQKCNLSTVTELWYIFFKSLHWNILTYLYQAEGWVRFNLITYLFFFFSYTYQLSLL